MVRAPSSWAAATAATTRLAREGRGQVAGLAVDPVADQLDPAVTAAGLPPHVLDDVLRFDLVRRNRGGSGGLRAMCLPARMQSRAGRRGRRPSGCPAGLPASRMSRVPASRSARTCVLGLSPRRPDACGAETDVTVRVDQAREHPAGDGLRGGRAAVGEGDPAVDHPDLAAHVVRPDEHRPGEVEDVGHGRNLRDRVDGWHTLADRHG